MVFKNFLSLLPLALLLTLHCATPVEQGADTVWGIEAKKPFLPAEELRLQERADMVIVSGETFSYTFQRSNGLLGKVEVLDTDLTGNLDIRSMSFIIRETSIAS